MRPLEASKPTFMHWEWYVDQLNCVGFLLIYVILDYFSKRHCSIISTVLSHILQEILTGTVPYSEYRNDEGIYRAMARKQPPRRPKVLPGSDQQSSFMWGLLLKCWDHNPLVRPGATSVYTLVSPKTLVAIGTFLHSRDAYCRLSASQNPNCKHQKKLPGLRWYQVKWLAKCQ